MPMTLSDLEADVYRRCGYATSPDATVKTRIDAFINEGQHEIVSEPGMEVLLYDSMTFASVANTPTYGLPQVISKIRTLYETTNLIRLRPQSAEWYRAHYPSPTAITGIPTDWVDLGYTAVTTQPAGTGVWAVSTAAGDTTQSAFVEGYRTGGYAYKETIALNGTTRVASAQTDYIGVTKFYLSAVGVGAISLYNAAAGGTELVRIPIDGTYARYRTIALVITPASAVTYTVDFEREPLTMSNANDQPFLPPRFHRLLAIGARMREYEKLDQVRYRIAAAEYGRGMSALRFFVFSQSVGQANLRGRDASRRPSRLGAQFAEDRW